MQKFTGRSVKLDHYCVVLDACRQNGCLMLRDIQTLITSQNLDVILHNTALLRNVDLRLLTTDEQRLCFYGNLLNLMMLHALTVCSAVQTLQVSFIHFHYTLKKT